MRSCLLVPRHAVLTCEFVVSCYFMVIDCISIVVSRQSAHVADVHS